MATYLPAPTFSTAGAVPTGSELTDLADSDLNQQGRP